VRDIIGPGSEGYRMVEKSLSGRVALLRFSLALNQPMWGWPLSIAVVAGIVIALWTPTLRRAPVAPPLIPPPHYLLLINVVLYAYDRYFLPTAIVEAFFAGVALDRILSTGSAGQGMLRQSAVAAIFVYTFFYASTLDVLMVRDSRYTAEAWMRERGYQGLYGRMFPLTNLPRLGRVASVEIRNIDDLRAITPDYFILNADYARAVTPDRPEAALAAGLQHETLGYRLAVRYRTPPPWPWLPGGHPDLVGERTQTHVYSVLYAVNPTIEIYERVNPTDAPAR